MDNRLSELPLEIGLLTKLKSLFVRSPSLPSFSSQTTQLGGAFIEGKTLLGGQTPYNWDDEPEQIAEVLKPYAEALSKR